MGFGDVGGQQTTKKGFGSVVGGTAGVGRGFGPKTDITTLPGLQKTAQKAGYTQEVKKIVARKGESPRAIFSGGIISDIFDSLNLLQYGVVGLLKGKSFAEGVKTRQSFSDKDALGEYGLPGTIGGIALDIAVDPLTYVGGLGIVGKVTKVTKLEKVGAKVISKIPLMDEASELIGRLFIYRFGQDPIYKEIAERTTKNIVVGNENLLEIVKPLTKLDSPTQKIIAEARKAGTLEELSPKLLEKAKPAFDELDRLGKEAVDVGLLKKEIYEQNVGKYIARLYKKHEIPEGITQKVKTAFDRKPLRIDLSRFKKRTDIPDDVREAMGEILEAGYPTAKALVQLNSAIERAKMFREVATKWGKSIAGEGLEKLADTKRLGELANKYVPKAIADDINEIMRIRTPLEKGLGKIVAGFKYQKVILNPATHARNIVSNFILNDFEGLSPARVDIYASAAKQLATKGKWYKEAKEAGLGLNTFASREIKDMLLGPEAGKLKPFVKKAFSKVADLYQKEEEFAKMAQYIFQRGKGLSPEDAWKIAERATFNYAQVTPFIRRVRESILGFPFITFTYKATPQVIKTAITQPQKIAKYGKIKLGIERMGEEKELERERKTQPNWFKDGFYMRLPIKDKYGRSAYLDLTYILPFGDLVSGEYFQRGINRATGLPESLPESLLSKSPAFNLIKEVAKNQDFYGNKIWQESSSIESQLGDLMRHIAKLYLPPLVADQLSGGYRESGERREPTLKRIQKLEEKRGKGEEIEAGGMQVRTFEQEVLRNIGLKIAPVDVETQEKFNEWELEKALRTLLIERGIIKEFTRPYIPK